MKRRTFLAGTTALMALPSLPALAQDDLRAVAREAYIYTYPMVKNYLTMYQYALEPGGNQYKGPLNTLVSIARVYTPEDTAIITPNSDTPYSFIVFDLRAEPVVVTMPPIEKNRYYSLQLIDLYTNNVDYPGTRVDGNGGGDFLVTGPGWKGDIPKGIKRVIEMPTALAIGIVRTQLFSPDDLAKVKEIQSGYKAQLLSAYAGTPAPDVLPPTDWPPISDDLMVTNYWSLAAFLLQFAPPYPGDELQRENLAKLGVRERATWPGTDLSPETVALMKEVAIATEKEIRDEAARLTDSSKIFGTPEFMKGRFMVRAAAAQGGIYGNSVQEALYVIYAFDAQKALLDGKTGKYTLTLTPETLPPVDAFWSLTMYDRPKQFLVDNPVDRYLINSPMLAGLKKNDKGEIVLHLQHESPGPELESNWLPAPAEIFYVVMRLYLPRAEALDGRWAPPPIEALS
ncbi:DUF1254 domain-containing protein [Rhizobium sp. S95]|uniref:DUF1254 domain-containing protein n=1 Tax=Ciceribacter sichuanensis TaxID=2949647 RepID=A0AAJ1BYJ4_9HYPH|nr:MULTISPECIES: DUF1254 domain-containing protein [unclassified Ciceribacter]MCM2395701.1 DUF1254 domain-containing protein [Ciceribacter sp. S95]MCM2402809.1 DUF1254 domain-containing protein [Ciceribacter sp. S153]MCO5958576.1 DUF1254 domain-containing protein [Ciceribacter sp. S101]